MLDHRKLLAEIEDEVRRRRDEDDALPDLERELDVVFARYAPVHAVDGDFERVLTRAAELTFVDPLAPTESRLPAITFTKRVIRKLSLWMLRHLSVQTTGFAETITRAVRLLGRRLDVLEQSLPVATMPDRERTTVPDEEHWAAFLAKHLADVDGRVLHVEAGGGSLVAALADAGVDVYGVDPTPAPVLGAASPSIDGDPPPRTQGAADHLAVVADRELAAAILSGWVDRLPLPGKTALLDTALAKVRPGGRVVVVGTDPRAWAASVGTVHADLAAGRPLHAETWRRLLDERGCTGIEVHAAPRIGGLEPVPDATPALAANLERVDELLFPPRSYAVTAVVTGP
jgi:hypothetical protein